MVDWHSCRKRNYWNYYNLTVVEYLKQGYNESEAQVFALKEIEEKFNIQIKEVTA